MSYRREIWVPQETWDIGVGYFLCLWPSLYQGPLVGPPPWPQVPRSGSRRVDRGYCSQHRSHTCRGEESDLWETPVTSRSLIAVTVDRPCITGSSTGFKCFEKGSVESQQRVLFGTPGHFVRHNWRQMPTPLVLNLCVFTVRGEVQWVV